MACSDVVEFVKVVKIARQLQIKRDLYTNDGDVRLESEAMNTLQYAG
jgi:hypothetical protein